MPRDITWVAYLTAMAREVKDQFVHLRGRKQRKRAVARLYPLDRCEHNRYRRHLWTRICRRIVEEYRAAKSPGRFRLDGE
jgi:hypothetical protein